jgi:hypothetical protein
MPKSVLNAEVEKCLREILERGDFTMNPQREHGQTGVDIVARKGETAYYIEVIGYKETGPARAKDFYEGFFRAVSRLNDGAKHLVLALSHKAETGLPQRAKQHRVAWIRLAEAFPELKIWVVNTDKGTYKQTSWREWAEKD